MNQERIHCDAHEKLSAEFATIGLNLSDRIPSSWSKFANVRHREGNDRLTRWKNAVELVTDLVSNRNLLDGRDLLDEMVDHSGEIRTQTSREEALVRDIICSVEHHKAPFASKPNLRYVFKLGKTTVFADARLKSYEGMLRRYALKEPALAQLDAMAAWIVVKGEARDSQEAALRTVTRHLENLRYVKVANLKTEATSEVYRVRTFQRTDVIDGVVVGQEIKLFTIEQFRTAEVDPSGDSARRRYERRRLIEFASRLEFPCTNLCIVRHGQTQGNAAGVLHGFTSSPLASDVEAIARNRGRLFATRAAKLPTAIFSSDLPRARDTAEQFAAPIGLEINLRVGLRERHLGALEGKPRPTPDTNAVFARYGFLERIPGGGESFAAMASRVLSTVQADIDHYLGKSILLVTHAGPIRALLGGIDGLPPALQWDMSSAPHLSPIHRLVPAGYLERVFDELIAACEATCQMRLM